MENNLRISVLITTLNGGINRVKKDLLMQFKGVEEVILSHQITNADVGIEDEKKLLNNYPNVKYIAMNGGGLSKNRNNALIHSSGDICVICDDDLNFKEGFEKSIKEAYENSEADIITFQSSNYQGVEHFNVKAGMHNMFSILRVWSSGITFRKESLIKANIRFDEKFGLGAKYPVSEENIFLTDCYKKGMIMLHSDSIINVHPDESSSIVYKGRKDLVISRVKVFKRIFGLLGGVLAILYFTFFHYKYYKNDFDIKEFFIISCKSLKDT